MPRKVFVAGEILTASDVNTNLMDQAVMVFDDAAARTAALPSPSEGMVTYLKDTDALEKRTASAWVSVNTDSGKILQVVSTTKTDLYSVSLASGATDTSDVTGLTATITPSSASNKILVTVTTVLGGARHRVGFIMRRDSTDIAIGDTGLTGRISTGFSLGAADSGAGPQVASFLDSPATTSPVTYAIRLRSGQDDTRTFVLNKVDDNVSATTVSTITLMEVAG